MALCWWPAARMASSPSTPRKLYDSPVSLPSNVQGRGSLDNMGNPVTFQFKVSQSGDR